MPEMTCRFATSGFKIGNSKYRPCKSRYHISCFKAGIPFQSRLPKGGGLCLPTTIKEWPHFICEACTVRAVQERELSWGAADTALVLLERMRIIDMAHNWALGTHKSYQSKNRILRDFEVSFRLPLLRPTLLKHPPNSLSIPLMWAQERYSLYPARWKRYSNSPSSTVVFGSIRGLRSAAAQFYALDLVTANPDRIMMDAKSRPVVVQGCLPTDDLGYSHFTSGMKRRIGEHSQPSTALLERHVKWIDDLVENQFRQAFTPKQRKTACRIAITNLLGWLGWLRAMETFSLQWKDMFSVEPRLGPTMGLPEYQDMILLKLLAQTKSQQAMTADVVLVYSTASGFSLGKWLDRLFLEVQDEGVLSTDFILAHDNGRPWTSHYYRHTFLYPFLETQKRLGDAFLQKFDGSPGNSIPERFWSFHCYRRGARTHVSRSRSTNVRGATKAEIMEHARWRTSRGSMDMPTAYLEWSFEDRIVLTLLCM